MKYTIALIGCCFLFAQCSRDKRTPEPTGNYDTLGVQWMVVDRPHITYYFQGTGVTAASLYTDMHEEAYATLEKEFKSVLPQKLRFFVWTDWTQAEQKLGYPLGFAVPPQCVCNVAASQTLGHEITHILSYWADGVPPTETTKFINEGLAVAFDLRGDDKIEAAKEAIKEKSIPAIKDIWSGNQKVPDEILYPLGGAFMDFLYKKNQPEKFKAFIKDQTIEGAEEIYGKDELNTLIADFNSRVGL